MSTELTLRPTDVVVEASASAEHLDQLPNMQASLVEWCREKLIRTQAEAKELWESLAHAKVHKWNTKVLKRHAVLATARVGYYEKVLGALVAGYCLFPTIDCDVFAVRTDKESPDFRSAFFRWGRPDWNETSEGIAMGEGEYVDPHVPTGSYSDSHLTTEGNQEVGRTHFSKDDFDKVVFPMSMSKPHVMDAVGKAMALKIFDEIGIIGDPTVAKAHQRRKGDPVIIGRVRHPRNDYVANGQGPAMTFLIAWHVDTKDL